MALCGEAACGKQMQLKRVSDCYPSASLLCNKCRGKFTGSRLVYHCPKNHIHPGGYDVCKDCFAKQNQQNDFDDLFSTFSIIPEQQKPKKVMMCECGSALQLLKAQDCYNGQRIWCDLCLVHVIGTDQAYHCSKGHTVAHPSGYDLCTFCAEHWSVATKVTATLRERVEAYKKAHLEQKRMIKQLQVDIQ